MKAEEPATNLLQILMQDEIKLIKRLEYKPPVKVIKLSNTQCHGFYLVGEDIVWWWQSLSIYSHPRDVWSWITNSTTRQAHVASFNHVYSLGSLTLDNGWWN